MRAQPRPGRAGCCRAVAAGLSRSEGGGRLRNLRARLRLDPPVLPACWPSLADQLQQPRPGLRVHALNVAFHAGLVVNVGWRPAGRQWLALPAPVRLEASAAYTVTLRLPRATLARLGGCRQPGRAGR